MLLIGMEGRVPEVERSGGNRQTQRARGESDSTRQYILNYVLVVVTGLFAGCTDT